MSTKAGAIGLLLAATMYAGTAIGDEATKILGRLTCTAMENDPGAAVIREVRCTFGMINGNTANYAGTIAKGDADERWQARKRILVWSVYGPTVMNSADLGGVYGRLEADHGSLRNVSGNGISLVPLKGRDQLPGNSALTVLELSLTATRA